jgi:hypothetical protein
MLKLQRYVENIDLLYEDNQLKGCPMTNNTPLNRYTQKLHKGVDNILHLRVINRDRKVVDISHLSVRARFTNIENSERVLERYCDLLSNKGEMQLRIREGDLVNIAPGFYNLVITGAEQLVPGTVDYEYYTPFYTDGGSNIVATVEIVANADVTPIPTVTLLPNDWTPNGTRDGIDIVMKYYSGAIPGNRVKNYLNGTHTFAAYTTNFSGTLQLLASLDVSPPENYNDYFPVDISTAINIITFDQYTGVTAHSFEANYMWLRFVYSPSLNNEGTLDKVMLR